MSMRISSIAAAAGLLLAGCGGGAPDTSVLANVEADQRGSADEAGRIECSPAVDAGFARRCTVERTLTDAGTVLTVRQPDGGFHRLLLTTDGRGVIAADGADPAQVTVLDNARIEVAIGRARYRLPATIGPVGR